MNLNSKNINNLSKAILSFKNDSEAKKFLRDLLTESEILEFANRWQAANMLDEKIPYTQIVTKTGLSSTTIARISKWLQNGKGGYKLIINRLHNKPSHGKGLH